MFSRSPSLLHRCWHSTPKITVPDLTFPLAFQLLGFCRISRFPGSELSLTPIFGFRPPSPTPWHSGPRLPGKTRAGAKLVQLVLSRKSPALAPGCRAAPREPRLGCSPAARCDRPAERRCGRPAPEESAQRSFVCDAHTSEAAPGAGEWERGGAGPSRAEISGHVTLPGAGRGRR